MCVIDKHVKTLDACESRNFISLQSCVVAAETAVTYNCVYLSNINLNKSDGMVALLVRFPESNSLSPVVPSGGGLAKSPPVYCRPK